MQYHGGVQYCGGIQYRGGYHDACGDILSTVGCLVFIMINVGVILSTARDTQCRGGYYGARGGYPEYRGGCSFLWLSLYLDNVDSFIKRYVLKMLLQRLLVLSYQSHACFH